MVPFLTKTVNGVRRFVGSNGRRVRATDACKAKCCQTKPPPPPPPACNCYSQDLLSNCGWGPEVAECCVCGGDFDATFDGEWRFVQTLSGNASASTSAPVVPNSWTYFVPGLTHDWTLRVKIRVKHRCHETPSLDFTGSETSVSAQTFSHFGPGRQPIYDTTVNTWFGEEAYNQGLALSCGGPECSPLFDCGIRPWAQEPWINQFGRNASVRDDWPLDPSQPGYGFRCNGTGNQPSSVIIPYEPEPTEGAPLLPLIYNNSRHCAWDYQQTCNQGSTFETVTTESDVPLGIDPGGYYAFSGHFHGRSDYQQNTQWTYTLRSTCDPNPCGPPTPIGACCQPVAGGYRFGGGCYHTTQANCQQRGHIYRGDRTVCAAGVCPDRFACCLPSTGCQSMTFIECLSRFGSWRNGEQCDGGLCPQAKGGCCVGDSCSVITKDSCLAAGGVYYGDGVPCGTLPCGVIPPVKGACCGLDGRCYGNTSEASCLAKNGRFYPNAICTDTFCQRPGNDHPPVVPASAIGLLRELL